MQPYPSLTAERTIQSAEDDQSFSKQSASAKTTTRKYIPAEIEKVGLIGVPAREFCRRSDFHLLV